MTCCYRPDCLDFQLAFHCAPVLEGLKPANLVSLSKGGDCKMTRSVCDCEVMLEHRGIQMNRLLEDERRILLLVYREALLRACLNERACRGFLSRYGYRPAQMTMDEMLDRLSERMHRAGGDFPHEVGAFLGYPLSDIQGFIRHKGTACKLSGYWKVYSNIEQAKHTFTAYDAVRNYYCRRVLRGENIHTIQYGGCCT